MLHLFVQQVMLWQSRAIKNILQLVSDINWWFAIVKIHQNQLKARHIFTSPPWENPSIAAIPLQRLDFGLNFCCYKYLHDWPLCGWTQKPANLDNNIIIFADVHRNKRHTTKQLIGSRHARHQQLCLAFSLEAHRLSGTPTRPQTQHTPTDRERGGKKRESAEWDNERDDITNHRDSQDRVISKPAYGQQTGC